MKQLKSNLLKTLPCIALASFPGFLFENTTTNTTTTTTEVTSTTVTEPAASTTVNTTTTPAPATTTTTTTTSAPVAHTTTHSHSATKAEVAALRRQVEVLNAKTTALESKAELTNKLVIEDSPETAYVPQTVASRKTALGGPGGAFPRFGIGSDVFHDDLYIHDFGLNRDLSLLLQSEYIQQTAGSFNNNPRVLISGLVSAEATSHTDAFGIYEDNEGQEITADSAIDFSAFVSDWWIGYFELDGDSQGGVSVDQILATVGNLDKFPGYATLGFIYVPNGSYRTKMITDSLPQKLARTRDTTAVLGFDYAELQYMGISGSVYVSDGEPQITETNRLNQWGANLIVRHVPLVKGAFAYDLGASFMNNIAGSTGISSVFEDDFILDRYVPAFNVRGKASLGHFYGYAEYVFAVGTFDQEDVVDLDLNSKTGTPIDTDSVQPEAGHLELGYEFDLFETPMTLAIAYDQTSEALAFGMPKEQYGTTLEIDVYPNTILSVEYTQLRDYSSSEAAIADHEFVQGTGNLDKVAKAEVNVFF